MRLPLVAVIVDLLTTAGTIELSVKRYDAAAARARDQRNVGARAA